MITLAQRIWHWGETCFGSKINGNTQERAYRFLEESLELCQALNMPKEDVLRMVDYVYGRPIGEVAQEFGGVGITLHLLNTVCQAKMPFLHIKDLDTLTELELQRCWEKIGKIQLKQLGKTVRAPL